ncbi:hypothetical protein D3C75_1156660 [compost metagenome]
MPQDGLNPFHFIFLIGRRQQLAFQIQQQCVQQLGAFQIIFKRMFIRQKKHLPQRLQKCFVP